MNESGTELGHRKSSRRGLSQNMEWGMEGELKGTKKLVEMMTSSDQETEDLFDAVIRKFVRDTDTQGPAHVKAVRELLEHQKEVLAELYGVVERNAKGWKVAMKAFSDIIKQNHYWIPGATLSYIESQFNPPLIGEKPFRKKEGMREPNDNYEISYQECAQLKDALDALVEKYEATIKSLLDTSTLELTQKVEDTGFQQSDANGNDGKRSRAA